jgi:hypothetical protein
MRAIKESEAEALRAAGMSEEDIAVFLAQN